MGYILQNLWENDNGTAIIKHRANLAGVVVSDHLDDNLFPAISFDEFETAKGLFGHLMNTNNNNIEIILKFFNWIRLIVILFIQQMVSKSFLVL